MGTSGIGVTDLYFIKTNSQGDTTFTKLYGGPSLQTDYGYKVHQTSEGGYILSGGSKDIGLSQFDIYLVRLNSNFDTLWTRTFGYTIGDEEPYALIQTNDGGFVIAGYTSSISAGHNDMYMIKTDSMGNGGCNQSTIYSHANNTQIYTNTPIPAVSTGGLMGFTQSVMSGTTFVNNPCLTVSIKEENSSGNIILYPNPCTSQTILSFSEEQKKTNIKIIDVFGKERKSIIFSGRQLVMEIGDLKPGIYFIYARNEENQRVCRKMIIQ
jgi:hypothetical protein